MNNQGQCPKCQQLNNYNMISCAFCGARLPWAGALETDRRDMIAAEKAAEAARQQALQAQQVQQAQQQNQQKQQQAQQRAVNTRLAGGWICETCGYVGAPKNYQKGNDFLGCILGLLFLLPGLIYMIWNSGTRHKGCASCKSSSIVTLNSPKGQMLMHHYYPNGFTP